MDITFYRACVDAKVKMRYLGNKTKLLGFLDFVIEKYQIEGNSFADLFAGTCSVGDHYKDRYKIIANDYMFFSSVLCRAKLNNMNQPSFSAFLKEYGSSPFVWLNNRTYEPTSGYFITENYSPRGGRQYFTEKNAIQIDGMRIQLEELYKDGLFSEEEYDFLLASMIESVLRVSNTSGTYQAFFKFWESRALKDFVLSPLEMTECEAMEGKNVVYNEDANCLVRKISGDIAYIDPPYTTTQYTNSYHLLETLARYDQPSIFGKTGRRQKRVASAYSNRNMALQQFEDLFRQLDFEHVLVSYSNQSIVPIEDIVNLAKLFAVNNEVHVESYGYKEYSTNNPSYKDNGQGLKETIIYFKKDRSVNKSPLNYSGSKDQIVPSLNRLMPKHVGCLVDAMGGAFNVGANVVATDRVVYNEYNSHVYEIIRWLLEQSGEETAEQVTNIVKQFQLKKKDKDHYLALRDYYNNGNDSALILFTLQIYAFQNIIRFNSAQKMNTPVGNNEFNEGTRRRMLDFQPKAPKYELSNKRYSEMDLSAFPQDTVFYFDPPYFITTAEYNDGKRGLDGWDADKESELLAFLTKIDGLGYKFMLSNVISHNGKVHHMLKEWVSEHRYTITEIGTTGIKYPRTEVAITNYCI